jgi:dTDP-glucose 4,6-dehydratase
VNYLITGGTGFIGCNLVRHLLETDPNAQITNLDALTYAGNLDSLAGVDDDSRYTFIHGDICDAAVVRQAMDGTDIVLNLAAESHVDRSILSDAPFVRTNVMGTQTLLAAALEVGVRRFVQVSTDEVYGELPWFDPEDDAGLAHRFTEQTPVAPRSPYAATKAAADHLALTYHITHGLDVVITRCSNNYGPYQFPEKLIPLMITHALEDRTLPVYGDGLYVRDWIHVKDHCRGLIAAAARGESGAVYNFGGNSERTNLSVIRAVLKALGKPEDRIERVMDRPGHDRRYAIDTSHVESELSWTPDVVKFEEGLADTIEWYLANEAWWRRVQSGEYWEYHEQQYGS